MKREFKSGNTTIIFNTDRAPTDPEGIRAAEREVERVVSEELSKVYGVNIKARIVRPKTQDTA
jgi:hypothetical protein